MEPRGTERVLFQAPCARVLAYIEEQWREYRSKRRFQLRILRAVDTRNFRALVTAEGGSEHSAGGNDALGISETSGEVRNTGKDRKKILSDHLIHPCTVVNDPFSDSKTRRFWVNDFAFGDASKSVCLMIVFCDVETAKEFEEKYKYAQKAMEKHYSMERPWWDRLSKPYLSKPQSSTTSNPLHTPSKTNLESNKQHGQSAGTNMPSRIVSATKPTNPPQERGISMNPSSSDSSKSHCENVARLANNIVLKPKPTSTIMVGDSRDGENLNTYQRTLDDSIDKKQSEVNLANRENAHNSLLSNLSRDKLVIPTTSSVVEVVNTKDAVRVYSNPTKAAAVPPKEGAEANIPYINGHDTADETLEVKGGEKSFGRVDQASEYRFVNQEPIRDGLLPCKNIEVDDDALPETNTPTCVERVAETILSPETVRSDRRPSIRSMSNENVAVSLHANDHTDSFRKDLVVDNDSSDKSNTALTDIEVAQTSTVEASKGEKWSGSVTSESHGSETHNITTSIFNSNTQVMETLSNGERVTNLSNHTQDVVEAREESLGSDDQQIADTQDALEAREESLGSDDQQIADTQDVLEPREESLGLGVQQIADTRDVVEAREESLGLGDQQIADTRDVVEAREESLGLGDQQVAEIDNSGELSTAVSEDRLATTSLLSSIDRSYDFGEFHSCLELDFQEADHVFIAESQDYQKPNDVISDAIESTKSTDKGVSVELRNGESSECDTTTDHGILSGSEPKNDLRALDICGNKSILETIDYPKPDPSESFEGGKTEAETIGMNSCKDDTAGVVNSSDEAMDIYDFQSRTLYTKLDDASVSVDNATDVISPITKRRGFEEDITENLREATADKDRDLMHGDSAPMIKSISSADINKDDIERADHNTRVESMSKGDQLAIEEILGNANGLASDNAVIDTAPSTGLRRIPDLMGNECEREIATSSNAPHPSPTPPLADEDGYYETREDTGIPMTSDSESLYGSPGPSMSTIPTPSRVRESYMKSTESSVPSSPYMDVTSMSYASPQFRRILHFHRHSPIGMPGFESSPQLTRFFAHSNTPQTDHTSRSMPNSPMPRFHSPQPDLGGFSVLSKLSPRTGSIGATSLVLAAASSPNSPTISSFSLSQVPAINFDLPEDEPEEE